MEIKFELDENGWIKDTDPLYEQLDQWHEDDEYDNILETIGKIDRKHWSNKLWFRVVSALNNKKMFDEAGKELEGLSERCETPADIAKMYYMMGYIYYMTDCEYKALGCYLTGMEHDPEDTANLSLQNECDDCRKDICYKLETLSALCERVAGDIKKISGEYSEKAQISEEEFGIYLGFLSAIRRVPGAESWLGLEEFFFKYPEAEKENVKQFLETHFGITDEQSLKEYYARNHVNARYKEVKEAIDGQPPFPLEKLSKDGRRFFEASMEFIKAMNTEENNIPQGGLAAWDISETIGLARNAYGCDLLTNSEYTGLMMDMAEYARTMYQSWEEYMAGMLFGAAYYMFSMSGLNINEAYEHLKNMTNLVLKGDLVAIQWISK